MKEQKITVNISDRPYRLTVRSENEEHLLRRAGTLIDEKKKEYANNFAYKDQQDLLAMVALQLAVDYIGYNDKVNHYDILKKRLIDVDKSLTNILED